MKMCCGCIESAPPALNRQPKVKIDKYILYKLKLKARIHDRNDDSSMVMHIALKLQSIMMLCSVYYEHIIIAEHIHLLPQITVLIMLMMMVMILLSTAGVVFSVGLSLSVHTLLKEEESGWCICVRGGDRENDRNWKQLCNHNNLVIFPRIQSVLKSHGWIGDLKPPQRSHSNLFAACLAPLGIKPTLKMSSY